MEMSPREAGDPNQLSLKPAQLIFKSTLRLTFNFINQSICWSTHHRVHDYIYIPNYYYLNVSHMSFFLVSW